MINSNNQEHVCGTIIGSRFRRTPENTETRGRTDRSSERSCLNYKSRGKLNIGRNIGRSIRVRRVNTDG